MAALKEQDKRSCQSSIMKTKVKKLTIETIIRCDQNKSIALRNSKLCARNLNVTLLEYAASLCIR